MIQKNWLKDEDRPVFEYLKKLYETDIQYIEADLPELYRTTAFLKEAFIYNVLYEVHTNRVKATLPKQNKEFLKTYKPTPGKCWQTCYDFASLAPDRFTLVEGYYDGMPSCYHWVIYDTYQNWYLDIHFDLLGVNSEGFTEKEQFTTFEYENTFDIQKTT